MKKTRSLPTQYSAARRMRSETLLPRGWDRQSFAQAQREIEALRSGQSWSTDHPLTIDEFNLLTPEDFPGELFEGTVYMAEPNRPHELLFAFLFSFLYTFVHARKLGEVFGSRSGMHVSDFSAPQPDVLFVQKSRISILDLSPMRDPADLVMEIAASVSSRSRDLAKLIRYLEAGVPEIWYIDMLQQLVRVYHRGAAGRYDVIFEGKRGTIQSRVVHGFSLRAKWLWSPMGDFPDVFTVTQSLLAGRLPR